MQGGWGVIACVFPSLCTWTLKTHGRKPSTWYGFFESETRRGYLILRPKTRYRRVPENANTAGVRNPRNMCKTHTTEYRFRDVSFCSLKPIVRWEESSARRLQEPINRQLG